MTDIRAAWIGNCIFWFWFWLIGSLVWVPVTFGLSLFGLLLAGGSAWAIVIPVGKPVAPHPQLHSGQFGPPPVLPPQTWQQR